MGESPAKKSKVLKKDETEQPTASKKSNVPTIKKQPEETTSSSAKSASVENHSSSPLQPIFNFDETTPFLTNVNKKSDIRIITMIESHYVCTFLIY